MRGSTKLTVGLHRPDWGRLFARPAVRLSARCAGTFLAAFLLSSLSVAGSPLPMAACLAACVAFWPLGVLALAGSCVGYFLFWGLQAGLEQVGIALLVFAGTGLFRDTRLPVSGWFTPFLCAALTAAIGFVFLLDGGLSAGNIALYAVKILLAAVCPPLYRQALDERRRGAILALGLCLFTALATVAPPYGRLLAVAVTYLVAVSSARVGLLPTLLCALAMDLAAGTAGTVTAALCAGALLCRLFPRQSSVARAAMLTVASLSWQLFFGTVSVSYAACAVAGSAAGLFVPFRWFSDCPDTEHPAEGSAGAQLRRISRVFAMLHRELTGIEPVACHSEISDVYDFTAEQVCRCCVLYHTCWEQDARATYQDLCAAAGPIMERGTALREDFPASFVGRCRHMEGFLTAVNQELEANLYRRQMRNRLQESRRILSGQYLFLSRFLGKLADDQYRPPTAEPQFTPDFSASSACRPGSTVSGDRCASFRDQWNRYYVLLCDGMGTGREAAAESDRAVRTLTGLLESGVAPDTAMELLNGFYVLQQSSSFATVDLLQLDLESGEGTLYKWGAAPSYLRTGQEVKKIGTAAPPPGLDVAAGHNPQQLRLSLKDGETLILVSDGAFGEETEKRIAGFRGSTSRELAGYVVAGAAPDSEDDLTAAVLRLVPGSSA